MTKRYVIYWQEPVLRSDPRQGRDTSHRPRREAHMTNEQREEALAQFGARVLRILHENDEWNGDIFDAIADIAVRYGLATTNEEGFFREVNA